MMLAAACGKAGSLLCPQLNLAHDSRLATFFRSFPRAWGWEGAGTLRKKSESGIFGIFFHKVNS